MTKTRARHSGKVYGHSKGKQPGSKLYYRQVYTIPGWDQFITAHRLDPLLQVCAGGSFLGFWRVDHDPKSPSANIRASMYRLPFPSKTFGTVACDPPYELPFPDRVRLQRELARVAIWRIIFKGPWIPRCPGWTLTQTVLIASHTCQNVAILSILDQALNQPDLPLQGGPTNGVAQSLLRR